MRLCRWIPLILILVTGCSKSSAPIEPPRHDSDQARIALVAALDAWKQGKAPALGKRTPPIRFVDDDQKQGWELSEYALEEPDAAIGLHKDVPVILLLRDRKGKTLRREARYQVATDPGLAVLRSDL